MRFILPLLSAHDLRRLRLRAGISCANNTNALAEFGDLQVPAIKNPGILTENGEPFLELQMLKGQDMASPCPRPIVRCA